MILNLNVNSTYLTDEEKCEFEFTNPNQKQNSMPIYKTRQKITGDTTYIKGFNYGMETGLSVIKANPASFIELLLNGPAFKLEYTMDNLKNKNDPKVKVRYDQSVHNDNIDSPFYNTLMIESFLEFLPEDIVKGSNAKFTFGRVYNYIRSSYFKNKHGFNLLDKTKSSYREDNILRSILNNFEYIPISKSSLQDIIKHLETNTVTFDKLLYRIEMDPTDNYIILPTIGNSDDIIQLIPKDVQFNINITNKESSLLSSDIIDNAYCDVIKYSNINHIEFISLFNALSSQVIRSNT